MPPGLRQEGRAGSQGLYLEKEKGRDEVVGHVEVVSHAGLVEWKPFEREYQLRNKGRIGVQLGTARETLAESAPTSSAHLILCDFCGSSQLPQGRCIQTN